MKIDYNMDSIKIKGIFSYNCDISKNAVLNWRFNTYDPIGNWIEMAEGFLNCAKMLIKDIIDNNKNHEADIAIFPLLNLFNQGIENSLKAIILSKSKKEILSHDLKELYKNFFECYFVYKSKEIDNFADIVDYINDISVFVVNNDYLMFTRYPKNTKNENFKFIKIKDDNYYIDLVNFKKIIVNVSDLLIGLMSEMYCIS